MAKTNKRVILDMCDEFPDIFHPEGDQLSHTDLVMHSTRNIQSGSKKCIHSLLINIFGINLNEISISG